MLFGAGIFATDYAIRPDELARELEQREFESLWRPEHTHIPVSRRTPFPSMFPRPSMETSLPWRNHPKKRICSTSARTMA